MSKYCIVISGRLLGDKEDVVVWQPIANAFRLDAITFEERVLPRMPLIVRQDLDEAAAQAMVAQLRAASVDAQAIFQDTKLVLIERDGQTKGPLPFSCLGEFIRDGERYRFRDSNEWMTWGNQGLTLELPPPDFSEASPFAPAAQNAADAVAARAVMGNVSDDMPPELPPHSSATPSAQKAASLADVSGNQDNPPPLPAVASLNKPRATAVKKPNSYAKVIGVIACLLVAWLALKALSTSFDSNASSLGGTSSGLSSQMDSSDLHKIASGHYYLVEYKPNGESNSWIGREDGKLTNIVFQVGNGFVQKCFMEQGEKTPSNCAPPMIEIGNGGSVHSSCVGGEGRMSGSTEAIWVCVSDTPVQGEPYETDSGYSRMTIPAGVPYVETSSSTSFGGGGVRHMRFKVVDSGDVIQLPAATGRGGK